MNRVYKVIYNRARNLYQVVSEIVHSRGKTKSLTAQHQHERLTTAILITLFAMGTSLPVGWAADAKVDASNIGANLQSEDGTTAVTDNEKKKNEEAWGEAIGLGAVDLNDSRLVSGKNMYKELRSGITSTNTIDAGNTVAQNLNALNQAIGKIATDGTYITMGNSVAANLTNLDKQVKTNAAAISTETTARTNADTALSNRIGTLDANGNYIQKDASISSNLSTLDTQVKTNANAIGTNTTNISANKTSIDELKTATTTNLATKADVNASNLTSLLDTDLTAWGTALGKGTIAAGSNQLITGKTIYDELTPTGTVYYIGSAMTTAARLTTLDNTLKTFADQLGVDLSNNTNLANQLYKYFKVNPKATTDGTTTYDPDAAANGTHSVAIGPSAQAGEKTTDTTTSATTVTGGTSSTAIGDSAKANGDQSVALGYGSEVLNASGSIKAVSGSTAIGSGAKVEGGSDSTALGSGATVDTASNAMALGKNATINKTATSGVAIGNGAVTGSADKTITVNNLSYDVKAAGGVDSVAIGTDASSAGSTSIALGKGATVENDSDGNYQAVVKSDNIAIGTDAKTSASDFSTAIGKEASVSQSTDALAVGSGAKVTTSKNAMAFGKGADAESAADSIAMGTSAKTISADTIAIGQNASATGANSVVIGKGATTTSEGGNAIGLSSTASGNSTAIGQSAIANNYNAVAIGNGATANADRSIALGFNAGVGTSEGKGETQNAGSLIAIGTSAGNYVSGIQNVAIGASAGSNVKSSFNVAIGSQAGYGINYASDNKSQNGYNVSIGYKANYQENSADIMYSTALGNEANASNYAVAIGDEAKASGTNSLALGYSAKASDAESMALGHNASAADGNVAIGNGSLALAVSSLGTVQDGYVYQSTTSTDSTGATTTTLTELKSAFTYKPLASDSHYISVGTSTLTRRISNVADGVFASDAATVGQLNSLNELLQATDTEVGLTKDYFEQKFTDLNTTIDASKTHYFSISESSDNLSANKDNTGATSNKADAMAIGPNANATNVKSLAVGNNVYATGLRSIAIGTAPNPTKDAAGTTTTHNTSAEGENSIALGTSTTAQADNSVAIGTRAQAYTTDTDSGKTGARSVAIGNLATTAGNQSVALGYDATVKYDYGTAIGSEALASGTGAVAVGKGSKAYSTDSTAIGQNNTVTGSNVYGLGSSNAISGNWGSIVQSGVSGYKNTVTSVSDQDTTNALTGIYMTGNTNDLNQQNKYNVMQDITVQGTNNKIYGGSNISAGHPNTLSQIAIVGSGNNVQGKSDDDGRTNNIENVTILGYNNKVDANTDTTVDFSNTQILGNKVTATLGNSVYLGNNAAYVQPTSPASDAITAARTAADTAAEASDEYKAAATDEAKAQIKAKYEAKYLYKLRVQAMEGKGTTAGMNSYDTDETYGNGMSYTYAGSNPTGVITVGSVGSERRIQNVAAGLVSATSTDAVNGSQLYALTRQIRFGGDNSSFGKTTAADDQNVVARGSNETIAITGGSDAVTASTADGTTTYTVDAAKLTGNNIAVVADKDANALHIQLASNLKELNTAQLGSGSGDSYKETIKLDGTGNSGGSISLSDATGILKNTMDTTGMSLTSGAKFTSSGISAGSQQINNVTAGTSDTDAVNYGQLKNARTLLTKGANTTLSDTVNGDQHTYTVNVDNLAVKANGTGTTVALANGINFKNGTNTTSAVDSNGNVTIDTKNLTLKANGTNTATVTMDNGINFKNGTNTTATVDTNGTVTISATHNKLDSASYTASNPSDSSNQTTLKLKDTDGNETTLNLTDTYTTVSKNTDHTITFKRNDGSESVSVSLGDLNGASNEALNKAAAKATTQVIAGANVSSVDDTNAGNPDGPHVYKVNVSNLGVKVADGQKTSVALSDGLVFGNGTNTTASVGDNGAITFNVSNEAIKTQAKDAINMTAGTNVNVDTETSKDGLSKTFTISATHNALKSATLTPKSNDVSTLTITGNDGDSASVDIENTHLTVSKDSTAKTVTFTSNDGITPPTTLSLSDFGAASTTDMTAAAAKATTEVKAGINATLGTLETDPTDQHKIYTVNVDNLGLKQNGTTVGTGTGVSLKNGLNFTDGTNTTASVAENGTISYSVSNDAIKAQAKNAVVVAAGDNVTIDGPADANNVKTYTVTVNDLKLQANGEDKGTRKLAEGINFANGKNTTATVEDGKVVYSLNDALTDLTSVTVKDTAGNQTLVSGSGVTITPAAAGAQSVSLTSEGLDNGNHVIKNVASGGDTDTNAANISDVKRLVQASASGTTETGFNVKGDDATAKKVKLGKQLNVVGGTNDTSKLSDGNIGVVTTDDGQGNATLTVKLNKNINLDSVKAGNTTLDTNGVSNGKMNLTGNGMTITDTDPSKQVSVTTNGVSMGSQRIQNVADATQDTDAATLKQVKNARTVVAGGSNVAGVTPAEGANNQMTYTVNVDNLSVKANSEEAKSVMLKNGLTFKDGTNTTASVGEGGVVSFGLKSEISLTKVTTGNTTMDTNGLVISGGPTIAAGGINAGGKTITGVANGVGDNDAVNISQLKAVQSDINAGWTIKGKDTANADVSANIGKGKSVTYSNGNYTKAVITKDDSGNAAVTVDVTTGTLTTGTDGKITSADGLATTGDVANAVNSASWTIQDGNNTGNAQQIKVGDKVSFKAGDNLSLDQNGKEFTYKLNKTLTDMTSVTAVDDKQNTSVLNSEGLKVSDKDGNSLTQHATEIRIHDSNAKADDTTTDVVLKKDGLHNGGHTITGVADGQLSADSKEAVNGSQLYALQQKVTNGGWDIIGDNENKSTHIGNDKTVSFKSGKNSTVSVTGTDTGAEVKVDVNTAQISTNDAHQATATGTGLADASEVVNAINSAAWNVQKKDGAVQQVKAGDTVTFDAGNNIVLAQNDKSFTYGLASDVNTNSIRLGGSQDTNGDWTDGIFIGKQIGGGANQNEGNYITGLANTSWDLAKVVDNRAATEAQLREAINQITLKEQNGGFALKDESGNEKGRVSQTLGNAIAIVGDTEYESDGKTVKKAGNITTEADGTNVGGIKVKLNKNLDLSDEGSLRVGSSKVSNGAIQLGEDASANKILMDSTNGTASIGGVTVNGAKKTVNGLSNTKWTGTAVDGQAATENQLVEAINEAKTQAANSELHIKKGVYAIGKDSKGQEITDKVGKNSVSIDVVNATGIVDGQVVINDVAKASELGAVGELAANLKNPAGGPTTVVQAINNVNQKVDDSLKQVNGDITSAVTEAKKHTKVANIDGDSNVIINDTQKTDDNGTVYKLGLNKDHVDLNQVHIYGNEGWVKTKKVEAETVKIDDKTNLDKTGLTTGNTTVADGRVVVGGDNGIKIEAKGDQQTISGLSNRIWTGKAVNGRAATEDQLQQAVENATATAAQNEQHIQSGNYDVGQGKGLDGKPIGKNSVAINVVSGDGTKPGDVKGQVVINNVAKADELGDVAKLNGTVRNGNGHPTSTVDAINNLDNRVETKVGDNTYSRVKGKEIADGDSATTAIGKLNNRMNDIYTSSTQHSSVSTVDANLTLSEGKNASGGTDYKLGLNKEHIDLGNVTINGNAGSIESKSMKSDSFTAGDTVVNKDGVKVGDKSALTGDSLKVGGKTYVDDKGVDANGQAIRNVGDGKNDGDAVNVKQVNDLAARQGEAIGQNAAHINQLDRAVNRLDSRINRVGAGAAALAALHPGNYDPDDKVDFAAGFGNYRGASAAAVGMYYHPDETTTMSVGASFGGGENMVNAGITWKMGKDSGHMRTQAAQKAVPVQFVAAPTQTQQSSGQAEGTKMPQPVTAVTTTASGQQVPIVAAYLPSVDNSTRAENDELKELLARQTAILEKLADQKTAPAQAAAPVSGEDLFPDVPENHWAYDFVAKLAQAGALKDCRVEDPANNPMLTRNDFAQILYTALKNGATKNPALNKDGGLNHLANEFRAELKNVKR
ncbi:ESPR-type extended signal peptide-containing protein [uncultured Mitsuokella sp.]|uniref:ESPR-type extended signal peptide-containing protein n=4 Tax=Mitsuokella TaxID=52225 RepID=UPI002594D90B|nr:ESPR-type extended signal peptide-containing protein [uncultured Mitsuokella sp.]